MKKIYLFFLFFAVLLSACGDKAEENRRHTELYENVKSVNKLVLSSLSVTKTPRFDDSGLWGKRIGVYSYDTYLRAYIDMSAMTEQDLQFDDKEKTVRILLPPVQTEFAGRDMTLREEYVNVTGFRSRFDSKERASMKEHANADLKKEVAGNPVFNRILMQSAKRKATAYFTSLFGANGYAATVEFKE